KVKSKCGRPWLCSCLQGARSARSQAAQPPTWQRSAASDFPAQAGRAAPPTPGNTVQCRASLPPESAMLRIQAEALTYDDVSLVPAHSTVLPRDVSLATRLTRDLRLNLPIVSAAMDTVTEARLAIAMAQLGGIGIVHKSMSAERQAAEVARVKN